MADELTSPASAPEQPSVQTEQTEPASNPEPQSVTPESTPQTREEPVNLQKFDEFKEYQRQTNKTIQQKEEKYQAEISQLKEEMEQLITRDMSDEELSERQYHQLQKELEAQRDQYNSLYQAYASDLAKSEISRKTGVDPSVIADASNPDEAWELALNAKLAAVKAETESRLKNALASSPGNSPDMGAGKPVSAISPGKVPSFKSNKEMMAYYRAVQDEMNS